MKKSVYDFMAIISLAFTMCMAFMAGTAYKEMQYQELRDKNYLSSNRDCIALGDDMGECFNYLQKIKVANDYANFKRHKAQYEPVQQENLEQYYKKKLEEF